MKSLAHVGHTGYILLM